MYGFCLIHANFFSPFHLSSFFSSSLPLIEACSTLTFFPPKCYCLQVTYDLFAHKRNRKICIYASQMSCLVYTKRFNTLCQASYSMICGCFTQSFSCSIFCSSQFPKKSEKWPTDKLFLRRVLSKMRMDRKFSQNIGKQVRRNQGQK